MFRAPYRPAYRGNEFAGNRGGNRYGRDRGFGGDHHHGGDRWRDHHRDRDDEFNGFYGYPYVYSAWPWYPIDIDPWLFGPDDFDSYDSYDQSSNGQYVPAPYQDYGEPPPDPQGYADGGPAGYSGDEQPGYGDQQPAYEDQPAMPQPRARRPYTPAGDSAPATPQQPVTVIFKDGRPPEQIHNYLLTPSTLTVLDGHTQQIPVDQIDMAATTAANRNEGIDFQLPPAAR
jgi:hypothetical protein